MGNRGVRLPAGAAGPFTKRWLLGLLLAVSFLRGVAYSMIVPLWQAPDEPGHYEYACTMARLGRPPARGEVDPTLERSIIDALDRARFWQLTRQARPEPLPATFAGNPFLRQSGTQLGDEPPLYYAVPAWLCRQGRTVEERAQSIRWFSVGLLVCATWLAWRASWALWTARPLLALGVPAFYALAPMPAFIGMSISNDSLALATSTGFYWALIGWCRHEDGAARLRSRVAWDLLLASALCLALLSKRTALFLLPLTLLMLASQLRRHVTRALLVVLPLVALLALAAALWRGPEAAAWQRWPQGTAAPRSETALSGLYALLITHENTGSRSEIYQRAWLRAPGRVPGGEALLTGWVRALDAPTLATIAVGDGQLTTTKTLLAISVWRPFTITHILAPERAYLRVALSTGNPGASPAAGSLVMDDVKLTVGGREENLLRNGTAEQAASRLDPLLIAARRYAKVPAEWPDAFIGARSYSAESLRRYGLYFALTFPGFWGDFGWLQLPLPISIYVALAAICGTGLVGLIRVGRKRADLHINRWQRRALWWLSLGVLMACIQVFIPMIGRSWQPQGRYLFPALWPVVTLLWLGLGACVPNRARGILMWAWVAGLVALDALALITTIIPAYR